jgi:hypothetical protein
MGDVWVRYRATVEVYKEKTITLPQDIQGLKDEQRKEWIKKHLGEGKEISVEDGEERTKGTITEVQVQSFEEIIDDAGQKPRLFYM